MDSPHHGSGELRGVRASRSALYQGRFGRLFRNLPPYGRVHEAGDRQPTTFEQAAFALARKDGPMRDAAAEERSGGWGGRDSNDEGESDNLHAGLTYVGQFLDHTITFDPTSRLDRANDPNALHNFRTPRLDLDAVYAGGPEVDPYLYDPDDRDRLGLVRRAQAGERPKGDGAGESLHADLVRAEVGGTALIGDPRNDENQIVSQLHLAFVRFHNRLVGDGYSFEDARRVTEWCFQWLVIHDFLHHILPTSVVREILDGAETVHELAGEDARCRFKPRFYRPHTAPFVPVEFAAAAYRFGHTMVRPEYVLQPDGEALPIFSRDGEDLSAGRALKGERVVDWGQFFPDGDGELQFARKIDTRIAEGLLDLHFIADEQSRETSLAFRNIMRGAALELPSGQRVARAMGAETVLANADAEVDLTHEGWQGEMPLWVYVLAEAEQKEHAGEHLGYVGGTIVGETLLGLIDGDKHSYWNLHPRWTPKREGLADRDDPDAFRFQDFLRFAEGES